METFVLNSSTIQLIPAIESAGLFLAAAGDELSTLCGVLIGSLDLAPPMNIVEAAHVAPPPARVSRMGLEFGSG